MNIEFLERLTTMEAAELKTLYHKTLNELHDATMASNWEVVDAKEPGFNKIIEEMEKRGMAR